jgi:NADPH:quinone reductase-like Zn-dependent oxidoreductase
MKAIVQERYGPPDEVLKLREIDPPAVKDDDVLVRVHAASVHPDVWHVVRGRPYFLRFMGEGLRRPKHPVPGTDLAGRVESVGPNVTGFQPGDEVFGECVRGHQWLNGGAYAEYASVRASALALKPANVTFEQAAAVPTAGLIALQNFPDPDRLPPGSEVLVNGAGGGVGMFALQLARAYGAHVTGVDHTSKVDLLRTLGADRVINYTQQDFTRRGERYDLIFDVPANHPFSAVRRVLTPRGTYVLIGHDFYGALGGRWLGIGLPRILKALVWTPFVRQRLGARRSLKPQDRLPYLKSLLEAGKLTPIIDRTFPLSELPEAIRYLETGEARGRIVITV